MLTLILTFLRDGIKSGAQLESNPLARQLFMTIFKSGHVPGVQFLAGIDMNVTTEIPADLLENDSSAIESNDYRLTKLAFDEVRRFPKCGVGNAFGLKFSKDDTAADPSSCIYLGANGVGKTTVFNCLEAAMFGMLPSLRYSTLSATNFGSYMSHLDSGNLGDIRVTTIGNMVYSRQAPAMLIPCFECSSADIRLLNGRMPLTHYIYQQLDIDDVYQLINMLDRSIRLVRGARQSFQKWTISNKDADKKKKERALRKTRKFNFDRISDIEYQYESLFGDNPASKDSWIIYAEQLQEFLNTKFEEWLSYYFNGVIEPIFKNLFEAFQDGSHDLIIERNGVEIRAGIKTAETFLPPHYYLNAFRMTMFCLSLKVALCCCAKKIYNINAPLIVDDIFHSGDFDQRINLVSFVKDMMTIHDSHCDSYLQIIYFTQDSLVADAFFNGILRSSSSHPVQLSRIIDYQALENSDPVMRTLFGTEEVEIRLLAQPINDGNPAN